MNDHQQRLGARLRSIRRQQGMTLHDVEERSGGQWKAVVVGSYERGDRAVSVAKLAELGEFYNVPVSELLPKEDLPSSATSAAASKIMLDLRKLSRADLDPELRSMLQNTRIEVDDKVLSVNLVLDAHKVVAMLDK